MSKGFGIHGSTTSHGGTVLSTQSRSSQMGNLFLRAGDGFACPKCKTWSTLIKSNDHVIFDGRAVAYVGDKFTCGATLMPKQVHVVGENGGAISGSNIANNLSTFTHKTSNYAHKFQIIDDLDNSPLSNVLYEIITPTKKIEGITDEHGYTEIIEDTEPSKITINILCDEDHKHEH